MTGMAHKNMAASVRARLMNVARENKEAFDLVLIRYALERLLYRVAQSTYREQFVVKGAVMFQVWSRLQHRPTRDLDLLGAGAPDLERFEDCFRSLCNQKVDEDGLVFVSETVTANRMKEAEEYEGIRMKLEAQLVSARIPIQVDIGFGDAITPAAVTTKFPTVLNFPSPELLSYPRETVVAEKFQAMVALGIANSRMKDFFDLYTLCNQFKFEGAVVQKAICATFERRKTAIPGSQPLALTSEFTADSQKASQWIAFLRKGNLGSGNLALADVAERLTEFLMPPSISASEGKPFVQNWSPTSGWC
ncbi:hypothetical protein SV7mr_50630 [Stieleria bergensis]|uniref:Nucleotidyl transferase AbiEii toxin, Type IV TA system n=1 Tax=Stieleria bergensis TaxID=2528025 RepID=A0A517T2A4_9BACT|nr:hypothetical protein SV7mr_50630 [Planctomycetes bacterium SV_7m_r]